MLFRVLLKGQLSLEDCLW